MRITRSGVMTLVSLAMLATLVVASPNIAAAGPVPSSYAAYRTTLTQFVVDQQSEGHFGSSVAVDGDLAVVGAPDDSSSRGAIYIFEKLPSGAWSNPYEISGPQVGAQFGASVDVSGDRIVVGAPYNDNGVTDCGAVYVYRRDVGGWVAASGSPLAYSSPQAGAQLGQAVAIDGDWLIAGMPGWDSGPYQNQGAVRFYHWNGSTWVYSQQRSEINPALNDWFGNSVDIDFNDSPDYADYSFAVVGAGNKDSLVPAYADCGSATVFKFNGTDTWTAEQTLWSPSKQAGANFGSVAITNSRIVVGEPGRDVGAAVDAGAAYTFTRGFSSWDLETSLSPYETQNTGDQYGVSVAIERNKVLVGDYYDDGYVGSVWPYVIRYGIASPWQKITPSGTTSTHFGCDVAVSKGNLLVGAQMSSTPDTALCGAAQVFTSSAIVTGTLRDALSGEPLPNIEVSACWSGAADDEPEYEDLIFTNAWGVYSLRIDAGSYVFGAMDPADAHWWTFYNNASTYSQGATLFLAPLSTTTVSMSMMPKKAPIFRFYNKVAGTHFYTNSYAEKNDVIAKWPNIFNYEGVAYYQDTRANTTPLYRLYNMANGSHFYTASYAEAQHAAATWPRIYRYEGPTYSVSLAPGAGKLPIYRFYNLTNGSHFYTGSETEKADVQAKYAKVFQYEGIAFYIAQ